MRSRSERKKSCVDDDHVMIGSCKHVYYATLFWWWYAVDYDTSIHSIDMENYFCEAAAAIGIAIKVLWRVIMFSDFSHRGMLIEGERLSFRFLEQQRINMKSHINSLCRWHLWQVKLSQQQRYGFSFCLILAGWKVYVTGYDLDTTPFFGSHKFS